MAMMMSKSSRAPIDVESAVILGANRMPRILIEIDNFLEEFGNPLEYCHCQCDRCGAVDRDTAEAISNRGWNRQKTFLHENGYPNNMHREWIICGTCLENGKDAHHFARKDGLTIIDVRRNVEHGHSLSTASNRYKAMELTEIAIADK